jgi:hypothetical protein
MDGRVFNPMELEKGSGRAERIWRREIPLAERVLWAFGVLCFGLFLWEWASVIIHPFNFGRDSRNTVVEKNWRWSGVSYEYTFIFYPSVLYFLEVG